MSENASALIARLEARIAHLERERERTQDEQTRATQEARRIQEDLLGRFSHDVRGPLNVISGFAEFMLDPAVGPLTRTQKEYLQEILASSRQLLEIAESLPDMLGSATPTRASSEGA